MMCHYKKIIMINEQFIFMYLAFWWLTCILYKDNLLPNLICETGEKLQVKYKKIGLLLQELSNCMFCIDNWIGTFFFAIPVSIINQDFKYLLLGFIFASISTHFRN